jgi:hypothetical protein
VAASRHEEAQRPRGSPGGHGRPHKDRAAAAQGGRHTGGFSDAILAAALGGPTGMGGGISGAECDIEGRVDGTCKIECLLRKQGEGTATL